MMISRLTLLLSGLLIAGIPWACGAEARPGPASLYAVPAASPVAAMPPVVDPANIYSETTAGHVSPTVAAALPRVYVPEHSGDTVSVIDPATLKVIDHYKVGSAPQHAVPSWDLKTIWVTNNSDFHRGNGSLTPI